MAGTGSKKSKRAAPGARRRPGVLRRLSDSFRERRFVPKTSARAVLAAVVLGLGGVTLGVGTYAQWLRAEELGPLAVAPYLLSAGLVLVVGFLLLEREPGMPLRVGDFGVGFERAAQPVERLAWHRVAAVDLAGGELVLESADGALRIPLGPHAQAARRVLAEARRRIPARVKLGQADLDRIGEPGEGEVEPRPVEPPQVAGLRCRKTDAPLTFEQDVRVCGRCAALYEKSAVPERCMECDAPLRA
ncbi:MAG: hypothetical protein HY744_04925 [Deltaproteobacteria bacterium]|nr:hypothetical protein [Deltaproteobacteria bacterium]